MGQYDFASLYGQADSSIFVYEAGEVDAVVESSTWGRTRDGMKGQWDIRFRVTTGPNAGRAQIKMPMTVSPDGPNGPQSLGIMFKHLSALGIPVPDQNNTQQQPFWALGWSEEQVAQAMVGRPVLLKIVIEEYEGVNRNKVRDIRPPRPGAPTTWPQFQQQPQMPGYGQPQGAVPGYGQQPQYQNYPTVAPAAPFPQQPQPQFQQPGYAAAQANAFNPGGAYAAPQQPAAGPVAPAPWQQPQGAPAPAGAQGAPNPAVPPWAQPPVPGAGGTGEFTQQGQSYQPSTAPFPQGPQQPPNGAMPTGYPQPGAQPAPAPGPGSPPWATQQAGPAQPIPPGWPAGTAPQGGPAPQTQQTEQQGPPPPPWTQ